MYTFYWIAEVLFCPYLFFVIFLNFFFFFQTNVWVFATKLCCKRIKPFNILNKIVQIWNERVNMLLWIQVVSFFSLRFPSHVHIVNMRGAFVRADVNAEGSGLWRLFSVCSVLSLDCWFNPSSPPLMRQLGPCHCVFMLEKPPLASQISLQSFTCTSTHIFSERTTNKRNLNRTCRETYQ